MKLGKKAHEYDERTLMMAMFVDEELHAPSRFDFDRRRRPFPIRVWGNDAYGNCVFAGQMNQLMRQERVEQRQTVQTDDEDVISAYKALTGCREPDDENDTGFVMLEALKWWQHQGWTLGSRNYKIGAYGELDPLDPDQLRLAIYLLQGVQLGFWLPLSAQSQYHQGYWDVSEGYDTEPGSWGGHAVMAKRYDADNVFVLTWGTEIRVSNAFVAKYCDEAWAVVDSLDIWRKRPGIDVEKLENYLKSIRAR